MKQVGVAIEKLSSLIETLQSTKNFLIVNNEVNEISEALVVELSTKLTEINTKIVHFLKPIGSILQENLNKKSRDDSIILIENPDTNLQKKNNKKRKFAFDEDNQNPYKKRPAIDLNKTADALFNEEIIFTQRIFLRMVENDLIGNYQTIKITKNEDDLQFITEEEKNLVLLFAEKNAKNKTISGTKFLFKKDKSVENEDKNISILSIKLNEAKIKKLKNFLTGKQVNWEEDSKLEIIKKVNKKEEIKIPEKKIEEHLSNNQKVLLKWITEFEEHSNIGSYKELAEKTELTLFMKTKTIVPPEICLLKNNLQKLTFQGDCIQSIPDPIYLLNNLEDLNLCYNQISMIPNSISLLNNLEILDIGFNKFTEIPESIFNLTKLRKLNVYNNQITFIPMAVTKLKNLNQICLSNNQISSVPWKIFFLLPNLKEFDIRWNLMSENSKKKIKNKVNNPNIILKIN